MTYDVKTEDLLRLHADRFRLVDNTDDTKRCQFLLSSITTATDRTYTMPDADGILALASASDGTVDHGTTTGRTDDDHTQYALLAGRAGGQTLYGGVNAGDILTLESTSNATKGHIDIPGVGLGDYSVPDFDLHVGGDNYGLIQTGDALIGRTSRVTGALDMDGTYVTVNRTNPQQSNILYCWLDGTNSVRFAIPKSGTGNATYNPRSMLVSGPAPVNDEMVTVGYWQTQGIFHNLACDTSTYGADLGVQNDLEVEGDIFTDSIKGSTDNTNIAIVPHGTGVVTLPTGSTLNSYPICNQQGRGPFTLTLNKSGLSSPFTTTRTTYAIEDHGLNSSWTDLSNMSATFWECYLTVYWKTTTGTAYAQILGTGQSGDLVSTTSTTITLSTSSDIATTIINNRGSLGYLHVQFKGDGSTISVAGAWLSFVPK